MNSVLIALLLAVEFAAFAILVKAGLDVLRGPTKGQCPACGHEERPDELRPCHECGRVIGDALKTRRRGIGLRAAVAVVVLLVCGFAATIALEGLQRLPVWALVRLADPLADPGSFGQRATAELLERQIHGEVDKSALDPVMLRTLDKAIDEGTLFVHRAAWPTDQPIRIGLRRATLNALRSGGRNELVLIAPDGSELIATSWGGISKTFAKLDETWAWKNPTLELPDGMRDGDGVTFDCVVRSADGTTLYRRPVRLPIPAPRVPVMTPTTDDALWDALVAAVRVRFSPVPREAHPDACVIVWFESDFDIPRDRSIALKITVEALDGSGFRSEGRVLVRGEGGLVTPSQTAPLALDHIPKPSALGRCRVRLESDPSTALCDFPREIFLEGSREVEFDLGRP